MLKHFQVVSFSLFACLCCGAASAQPADPVQEYLDRQLQPPHLTQDETLAKPESVAPESPPPEELPAVESPVVLKAEQKLSPAPPADGPLILRAGPSKPVTPPARPTAPPREDEHGFPRYDSLKPQVAFWTRVFSEISENQSAIHSTEFPHKVFTMLDFRDDAQRLDAYALDRLRSREERASKVRIDGLLKSVHAKRATPQSMSADEKKIFDLFADVRDDHKFIKLVGTLRAQRGLKERTHSALETAGKYLPEMERIFARYQLPRALTRLPLVESSFNVEAYSKVGAAGLWQFMPSSARMYMRLNEVVDDRRDPWTSTDAAARHLMDDYAALGSWPLAITAYNHGRSGVMRALKHTNSTDLAQLVDRYRSRSFGFASRNFYTEFLAAVEVERDHQKHFGAVKKKDPVGFEIVETRHYVPYETLRRLCGADDEVFRKLNPAYRPEVIDGKLYVPPGHLIRVPSGSAKSFEVGYARLGEGKRFDAQRAYYLLHKVGRGDTLSRIAKRYRVTQASVRQANGLKKNAKLRLGQVLKISPHTEKRLGPVTVAVGESKPAQTREQKQAEIAQIEATPRFRTHRVKAGQTLTSIARTYKVTIASLRAANDLGRSSLIRPGMKLKVPLNS